MPKGKPATTGELTPKQRIFVREYLKHWNATEAAASAGYKGSRAVHSSVGNENLRKPLIIQAISEQLKNECMGPEEVLHRLARMARASHEPFISFDEHGKAVLDLGTPQARRNIQLIKKIEQTVVEENDERRILKTRIEIHDPKAALDSLAKAHGLNKSTVQLTGLGGGPIALKNVDAIDELTDEEITKMFEDLAGVNE